MSKILFVADFHGNMIATQALEKEIEKIKPDDIWFLGDAVGKGPEGDLEHRKKQGIKLPLLFWIQVYSDT